MGALGIRPRVKRMRIDHGLGKARARSVTLYDTNNMTENKAPRMLTCPVIVSEDFGYATRRKPCQYDSP